MNLRKKRTNRYATEPISYAFKKKARDRILPLLKLQQRHKKPAIDICYNLFVAKKADKAVADGRKHNEEKQRARIWDKLEKENLCRTCIGNEFAGKVTRYFATEKFMDLLHDITELKQVIPPNCLVANTKRPANRQKEHAYMVIKGPKRDERGKKVKVRRLLAVERTANNLMEELNVKNINNSNLSHDWLAFNEDNTSYEPNILLRSIHSGALNRAARLYSWSALSAQNIPKSLRKKMLIDNEPVTELDFSCMFTRMLYHITGLDPEGDLYKPKEILPVFYRGNHSVKEHTIVRNYLKRCTNICWNSASKEKALRSIRYALHKSSYRDHLNEIIYNEEKINPEILLRRIKKAHRPIARYFHTNEGAVLMTIESSIMFHVLLEFANYVKPVLCLHDAILCKKKDTKFGIKAMKQSYRKWLGFNPVVVKVY